MHSQGANLNTLTKKGIVTERSTSYYMVPIVTVLSIDVLGRKIEASVKFSPHGETKCCMFKCCY